MKVSEFYLAISALVLIVIAGLFLFIGRRRPITRLTPLAGLAFGFVLAGLFFEHNTLIGYSLLGVGVILAVIDIVRKSRKHPPGI
jgi:hypothetical protein